MLLVSFLWTSQSVGFREVRDKLQGCHSDQSEDVKLFRREMFSLKAHAPAPPQASTARDFPGSVG